MEFSTKSYPKKIENLKLRTCSHSNNPTPPRNRQAQIALKSYHSSKHSKAEDLHFFSSEIATEPIFFPNSPINPVPEVLFPSSSSKQVPRNNKRQDSSDVLITEIHEQSRPYIKSLNVSWGDSGGVVNPKDLKKTLSLGNSLNNSIVEQHKACKNTLERLSGAKLKIDTAGVIPEQNESQPTSPVYNKSIRKLLNMSIIQNNKCELIDFYKALDQYNQIDIMSLRHKSLFKSSFFSTFCFYCFKSEELDEQSHETCEKFVRFVHSPIDLSKTFHKNLLISACVKIFKVEEIPEDPEDILKTLVEKIRCGNEILLGGFFNVLFLDCFYPEILVRFEQIGRSEGIEVLDAIYELSRLNMRLLRGRKMNFLILNSKKCLESVFFVFAGLCLFYVSIEWKILNLKKRVSMLEDDIKNQIDILIDVAKRAYLSQVTQV